VPSLPHSLKQTKTKYLKKKEFATLQ